MSIIIVMAIFFIVVTLIFVALAIFLPEWMGITGERAKRIIAEQQEDSTRTDLVREVTPTPPVLPKPPDQL